MNPLKCPYTVYHYRKFLLSQENVSRTIRLYFIRFDNVILCHYVLTLSPVASIVAVSMHIHEFWAVVVMQP